MRMMTIAALLIAGALAVPARAQDDGGAGAEDRFHDAYVAEVIEGRIADAAKTYLELMDDEAAPARVRAESRFRFAVCAVLLGRADEARAQLGALIRDPATPASLRDRATEYARTVEGIGVGSELTKKLEALVFDLGRASPIAGMINGRQQPSVPDVYRDFEIIGPAAIPFLRKLLAHPDLALRRHAMRLLLRMDADGMVDAWTPEIGLFPSLATELKRWFEKRPEERRRFETRLLALPKANFDHLAYSLHFLGWLSPEFVREAACRLGSFAADLYSNVEDKAERRSLLYEWMRGEDDGLAVAATDRLLRLLRPSSADLPPDDLLAVAVERLVGSSRIQYNASQRTSAAEALARWAAAVAPSVALSVAGSVLDRCLPWEGEPAQHPVATGFVSALTEGLLARGADELDPEAYAALLRRWIEAGDAWVEKSVASGWRPPFPDDALVSQIRHLLTLLSAEARLDWIRDLFGEGDRPSLARWIDQLVPQPEIGSSDLWIPVFRLVPPLYRSRVLGVLPVLHPDENSEPERDDIRRVLSLVPEILPDATDSDAARIYKALPGLLGRLPAEEREPAFLPVLRAAAAAGDKHTDAVAKAARGAEDLVTMAPLVPAAAGVVPEGSLDPFLAEAFECLSREEQNQLELDDAARAGLVAFLRDHLDLLTRRYHPWLVVHPRWFPLDELILDPSGGSSMADAIARLVKPAEIDAAVERLAAVPERLGDAGWWLLSNYVTEPVRARIVAKLLATATGAPLTRAVDIVDGLTSEDGSILGAEVLEATVRRFAGMEEIPHSDFIRIAFALAEVRPSEALFPVVNRLLASEERVEILSGITLAKKLGREESVPALVKLLDSMDPKIRDEARAAMDSILELKRLKEEAENRYGSDK